MLDTHDSLTDHFKHRRTATQLSSALRDAGLNDVTVAFNGGVMVCRGTRP